MSLLKTIMQKMLLAKLAYLGVVVALLASCTATINESSPTLLSDKPVYVMPFVNQSNMPMAQAQVEQLVASVLAQKGLRVKIYPRHRVSDIQASLEPEKRAEEAENWIERQQPGYVVAGAVHEWHYKTGIDGEPTVGFTLTLQASGGEILWRGSSSKSGWGRESLTQVGIEALTNLLEELRWSRSGDE